MIHVLSSSSNARPHWTLNITGRNPKAKNKLSKLFHFWKKRIQSCWRPNDQNPLWPHVLGLRIAVPRLARDENACGPRLLFCLGGQNLWKPKKHIKIKSILNIVTNHHHCAWRLLVWSKYDCWTSTFWRGVAHNTLEKPPCLKSTSVWI